MKLLLVFASVVVAISAASDQELWSQFKEKHSKSYKNLREERLRFNVFTENLRVIEEHNAKYENGQVTYYKGINQFTDLTLEEFRQRLTKFKLPTLNSTRARINVDVADVPDSVDWRTQGAVLEVKNQGDCGGCWAFSVTGVLEGQNAIKYNKQISLSDQELLDCTWDYGNMGCNGGNMLLAYDYVKDEGIATNAAYPWDGDGHTCRSSEDGVESVLWVASYEMIDEDEDKLKVAVATIGPISIGIDADYLSSYAGGIYTSDECSSTDLDHAVLAVGYGTEEGQDYWLVKNSWGADWGEEGFVKMARNRNNQCGVVSYASYPLLK